MTFNDLGLIQPLLDALATEGYTTPTPIQQQAIPHVLQGRDLLGVAQTGTGKTAAFALPMLQRLHNERQNPKGYRPIRALILTPTRELAIQIDESFAAYGRNLPLRHAVIFGGVGQKPQTDALRAGIDVLVATPGRLLDLMNQGFVALKNLEIFVLDEADRMLDMGFIHDVKRIIAKLPTQRQSLFFSATMPPDVAKLADTILVSPAKVEVTPVSSTADTVQQAVYFVSKEDKRKLLAHILQDKAIETALVFARTKHGADRVAKDLVKAGISAEAIHGNKSQTARQRALSNFKSRQTRVLVATDIAARGIDIDDLTHVVNFELPNIPETYVHRIGRTGRAGASGMALSFCDDDEVPYLRDIQKLIGKRVPVDAEHPFVAEAVAAAATQEKGHRPKAPAQPQRSGGQNHRRADGQRSSADQRSGQPSANARPERSEPRSGRNEPQRGEPRSGNRRSDPRTHNQPRSRGEGRQERSEPESWARPEQSHRPSRGNGRPKAQEPRRPGPGRFGHLKDGGPDFSY